MLGKSFVIPFCLLTLVAATRNAPPVFFCKVYFEILESIKKNLHNSKTHLFCSNPIVNSPGIALIQIRLLTLKYLCMAVLTDFSFPSLEHVVRVLTNGSLITLFVIEVLVLKRPWPKLFFRNRIAVLLNIYDIVCKLPK